MEIVSVRHGESHNVFGDVTVQVLQHVCWLYSCPRSGLCTVSFRDTW
jgi:hypothetical protein